MPNNNKKVKKGRGTVLSLNSFLGDTPMGTVVKKISSTENEEGDEDSPTEQVVLQLPTAPKANRLFDDDSIPHKPPFVARLSNLPFDGDEEDIHEFFGATPIVSLRLPREDGDTGRVRGFGNIEFDTRDDLIRALSMPDPTLRGRRIRIELFNEGEHQGNAQRMNKRGYSSFADSGTDRESTNWRRDSAAAGGGGDVSQNAPTARSYGFSGGQRETSGWRHASGNNRDEQSTSSWRNENRPNSGDFSSWRNRSDDDRNRDNFTSQRNYERSNVSMDNRGAYAHDDNSSSWRNRNDYGRRTGYSSDSRNETSEHHSNQLPIEERPRLELRPRTLPMPEIIVQEDAALRSTTPEETEIAAMPDGAAQLEANAGGPVEMINQLAAEPDENARMENIARGPNAMDNVPEAAAQPNRVADAQQFAAMLKIADEPRARHDSCESGAREGARNWRRCNELNVSLEADSGHDSEGAAGYDK